jgi:hypothetical protein
MISIRKFRKKKSNKVKNSLINIFRRKKMNSLVVRKVNLKNIIVRRLINLVYYNKLYLKSCKLDSDEFDYINDKLSRLYKMLMKYTGLSLIQVDRLINKLNKKLS